jgi:hypothetical protein
LDGDVELFVPHRWTDAQNGAMRCLVSRQ